MSSRLFLRKMVNSLFKLQFLFVSEAVTLCVTFRMWVCSIRAYFNAVKVAIVYFVVVLASVNTALNTLVRHNKNLLFK